MTNLFVILLLTSIICLFIGLIDPKMFSRWFKKKTNRKTIGIFFGCAIVLFIILTGITTGSSETKKSTKTDSVASTPATQLTPEEESTAKKKAEEDKAKAEAEAKAKAEASKELNANVGFNNVAFKITNNEDKNWTGCKFVLNGKLFGNDYTYKSSEGINAKDSIIVVMNEFSNGDGTRFDPFTTKAKNLFIACEVEGNHRTNYFTVGE